MGFTHLHPVVTTYARAPITPSVGQLCGFVYWKGRVLDMKKNCSINLPREKALHKKNIPYK